MCVKQQSAILLQEGIGDGYKKRGMTMKIAFVTLEVAEMILHMASVCYSEGMIMDDEVVLCQELIEHYPMAGKEWFREWLGADDGSTM